MKKECKSKEKKNFLYRGAGTLEMYITKIATIHEIIKIVFFPLHNM